jgi:branched-chain amino acid transport system substrate-binding protein
MKPILMATAGVFALCCARADAADHIKLGFEAGMSGSLGIIGAEMRKGLDLALELLDNKLGGVPVTVYAVDDQTVPAIAVQQASKLVDEDKVDIVTGIMSSNTNQAVRDIYLDGGVTLVGALSGLQQFAGKDCRAGAFYTAFENEDWDDAVGRLMNDKGIKTAYFMGADYQAGWEKVDGAIRTYKGKVVGKVYTPLTQLDFAAEIAQVRSANPDAMFIFYPGGLGIAFLKQWQQAGLQDKIPMYTEDATANDMTFPALGDAALNIVQIGNWSYELDNPQNKAFVAAFVKKYGRRPTVFSALQFDAINLISAAVGDINGKIEDQKALWAALHESKSFHSVRGAFKFNNNNYPINNIYTTVVEKDADGKLYQKLVGTAAENWQDLYHQNCALKG